MKEIRVHGRGGQGVVLASEIFVNALIKEGKHAACFPYFGFERRGAPVVGFIRFDQSPIRQKDQIYHPDCVVVMDGTLLRAVNIYQEIKEQGVLILNESKTLSEITIPGEVRRAGLVDATRISMPVDGGLYYRLIRERIPLGGLEQKILRDPLLWGKWIGSKVFKE
jgi:phenylglyoxylate dehydrogenase gamma subunit